MELVGFILWLGGLRSHRKTSFVQLLYLRAQTCDVLKHKSEAFEPLWDRLTPAGQPCSSLNQYLTLMRNSASWAGELEI